MSEQSTIDWDEVRRAARIPGLAPPEWPPGVQPIALEGVALLGIDRDNGLYWDGRAIEVKRTLDLSFWQKIGALIVILGAVGGFAQGVTTTIDFGCQRGFWPIACQPKPPAATPGH